METLEKGEKSVQSIRVPTYFGLELRYIRLLFKVQLESISHHCVGLRETDAA